MKGPHSCERGSYHEPILMELMELNREKESLICGVLLFLLVCEAVCVVYYSAAALEKCCSKK
jgi:hypothetical protein